MLLDRLAGYEQPQGDLNVAETHSPECVSAGGRKVAGSNPVAPTIETRLGKRASGIPANTEQGEARSKLARSNRDSSGAMDGDPPDYY